MAQFRLPPNSRIRRDGKVFKAAPDGRWPRTRAVERQEYGAAVNAQVDAAREDKGEGDLAALLRSGATWEVS